MDCLTNYAIGHSYHGKLDAYSLFTLSPTLKRYQGASAKICRAEKRETREIVWSEDTHTGLMLSPAEVAIPKAGIADIVMTTDPVT